MPALRVEYAKSGRAKCTLTSCKKAIAKHEVRIGTIMTLPFGEEGVDSVKYRHLCCFTTRQLDNARASGDLDGIEGYNDLAPADQALVEQMKRGELVGKAEIIGRVGDVANSPLAAELGATGTKPKPKPKGKAAAAAATAGSDDAPPKRKRVKKEKPAAHDDEDMDSDATEEFDVEVRAVAARPVCPYGANCFRTAPEHFEQFSHDDTAAAKEDAAAGGDGGATALRPVVVGARPRATPPSARPE